MQQLALHGPESDAERSSHGQAVVTHRHGFMSFGWSLVFLENRNRTSSAAGNQFRSETNFEQLVQARKPISNKHGRP
jgi:hypothetical protein